MSMGMASPNSSVLEEGDESWLDEASTSSMGMGMGMGLGTGMGMGVGMGMDTGDGSGRGSASATSSSPPTSVFALPPSLVIPAPEHGLGADAAAGVVATQATSPVAATRLAEALHKLRQVDLILEHLSGFWSQTEVVLDSLTRKGQHVEQLIGFAQKPRLMARFRERVEEYKQFWQQVAAHCQRYASGVALTAASESRAYSFCEMPLGSGGSGGSSVSGGSVSGGGVESSDMISDIYRSSSQHLSPGFVRPVEGARIDKVDSL